MREATNRFLDAVYLELEVPRIRARQRVGRCYEFAARAVLEHKTSKWAIVHGVVRGAKGESLGHAWLERGALVYDPVKDFLFSKLDFYRAHKAKLVKRYSPRQVARLMLESKSYGPWWNVPDYVVHSG